MAFCCALYSTAIYRYLCLRKSFEFDTKLSLLRDGYFWFFIELLGIRIHYSCSAGRHRCTSHLFVHIFGFLCVLDICYRCVHVILDDDALWFLWPGLTSFTYECWDYFFALYCKYHKCLVILHPSCLFVYVVCTICALARSLLSLHVYPTTIVCPFSSGIVLVLFFLRVYFLM